jgi:hypothetical protein
MKVGRKTFLGVGSVVAALSLPSIGAAQEAQAPLSGAEADAAAQQQQQGPLPLPPEPATLKIRLKGASGHTVHVNHKVRAYVRLRPFVDGEKITVRIANGGKTLKRRDLKVEQVGSKNVGVVKFTSPRLLKSGGLKVRAAHEGTEAQDPARKSSHRFHVKYPNLHAGQSNSDVRLFNRLLDKRGYYVTGGSSYGDGTKRAVMAFRKVNRMPRNWDATPGIFRTLANGKGGFHLRYPGAGRHVEVDISRQVMVLADGGKARHIFHVSTGAPATPTIRGHFHFYRKDPGFNSVGMYYSVYFIRGYATHGYHSVPAYNASHGCVRNPIPNSKFIYNWISLGMSIYTYG